MPTTGTSLTTPAINGTAHLDPASRSAPPYTIGPAAPVDIDPIAGLLAEAFTDDLCLGSVMRSTTPIPPSRSSRLFRALLTEAPLRAGTIDVAWSPTGLPLAAAVWVAPEPDNRHRTAPLPPLHVPPLSDYLHALGPSGILHAARLSREIRRYRPRTAHWYLATIGVTPPAHGQGLGGHLLRYRLAQIDALDQAAYLESASARTGRLYRRHGFTPLQPIRAWRGATPWSMWRAPASLRSRGGHQKWAGGAEAAPGHAGKYS
ncbi:MAG: GNAT family N-acetyltransferase [Actinomyces bowdenii]|nr:GNAT family N-acetyltransferase [Actinomyces bowdenii]